LWRCLLGGLCPALWLGRFGRNFLLFLFGPDAADGDDLQRGQVSAASVMHAHALFRLVSNALHARSAPVRDHLGVDVEAVDRRTAHLDLAAVIEQQDSSELDRRARLRGEAVDQDLVAGRHAVLLAAADDDSRQRTIWLGHGERLYQASRNELLQTPPRLRGGQGRGAMGKSNSSQGDTHDSRPLPVYGEGKGGASLQ